MRLIITAFALFFVILSGQAAAQNNAGATQYSAPAPEASAPVVDKIARDVSKMTTAVESLSQTWKGFAQTFSTNQGLQLTPRQQKLILAFEILNRTEQSLANMIKLRLDLAERQSRVRMQLARVNDDLLPQSIDRYVSTRGTTNAEALREIRRDALSKEQRENSALLSQIQQQIESTNQDIDRTEAQIRHIRSRLFGEVEKELADL